MSKALVLHRFHLYFHKLSSNNLDEGEPTGGSRETQNLTSSPVPSSGLNSLSRRVKDFEVVPLKVCMHGSWVQDSLIKGCSSWFRSPNPRVQPQRVQRNLKP